MNDLSLNGVADGCYVCANNALDPVELPSRERILLGPSWRVAHAFGTDLPGWLVVAARRHVVSLADLTQSEAAELGLVTWYLSQALEAVLGCEKAYVACFSESAGFAHLHLHVVPRAVDLPVEARGPAVFGRHLHQTASELPEAERDRIADRLHEHLMKVIEP